MLIFSKWFSQRLLLMGSSLLQAGQDLVRPRHCWNSCGELTCSRIERRVTVDVVRGINCSCVSVDSKHLIECHERFAWGPPGCSAVLESCSLETLGHWGLSNKDQKYGLWGRRHYVACVSTEFRDLKCWLPTFARPDQPWQLLSLLQLLRDEASDIFTLAPMSKGGL